MKTTNNDLLTQEEEYALARIIKDGQEAERLIKGCQDSEYDYLMAKIKDGTMARDKLVVSNAKLVSFIASSYLNQGVDYDDLYQSGMMSLVTAANKFSADKGTKFSTYASLWIKQSMARTIADEGRAVRLPDHVSKQVKKIKKITNELSMELSRKPSAKEIAKKANLSEEDVIDLLGYMYSVESLDKELNKDNDTTFQDMIPDNESLTPLKYTMAKKQSATLEASLNDVLDGRENIIVRSYFGLDGLKPSTYEEISQKLNISKERTRQILNRSLEKIRSSKYASDLYNMLISSTN
jgi:RNA polymerase primary sigma factor